MNTTLIALLSVGAAGLIGLGARTWLKALIERLVSAKFDREIEAVRSDLRLKEAKITSLQSTVLGGSAARRAIVDRRRLEALENLWLATIKLDKLLWATKQVAVFKLDELDKRAVTDPKVRQLVASLTGGGDPADLADFRETLSELGASQRERLYIPVFAWKVFQAYQSVLVYCYVRLRTIAVGIGDTDKMFDHEKMIEAIKEVMPHFSEFLDEHGITGAALVVDPLRELLFQTIAASLDTEEGDNKNLTDLVRMVEQLDEKFAQSPTKASN